MKKIINYVLGVLLATAICSAATAVVKVYVVEQAQKSDHEMIHETHETVKEIRSIVIRHMDK